ncbi:MAG: hypothetical protein CMJ28_06965 [Phycisphaerae bacterium]|nr:hypothetical protein [Phycisphaerae bacterium]
MVNALKMLRNVRSSLGLVFLALVACQPTVERLEDSAPAATRVQADFRLEVPQVMRGTIAQETILVGFEPVAVEGYGLVVGLDGTGCTTMPPDLRAHMSADMTRRGIGPSGSQGSAPPPERMLNDSRTAVVIVRGTLPAGSNGRQKSSPGTQFDLEVIIDPRTDATSLLGGRLYTCDLRPASGNGLPPTGSRQADALSEGKGPLFVNPFALRGGNGQELIDLTRARIIGGGEATKRVPLRLRLASPSHARARMIASAVNARFPQDPGVRDNVARGESDEMISIVVPPRWSQDTTTFAQLLRHTTIQQARQEASAALVGREIQRNPRMALDAAWRWRAMGPKALATTRSLYDAAERRVREAALKAGSWLDDPLVLPHLESFSESEDPESRRLAAVLMAELPWDPRLEFALAKLVDDPELDIRLAAYEALVDLGSSTVRRIRFHPEFEVDLVESDSPLVYITQTLIPRVVVFAPQHELARPLFADLATQKVMAVADDEDDLVRLRHDGKVIGTDPTLLAIVQSLATPEDQSLGRKGFGMDYASTVGALYGICRSVDRGIPFRAQQDRMLATLARRFEVRPDQTQTIRQDFDTDLTFAPEDPNLGRVDFDALQGISAETSNQTLDQSPPPPEAPRTDFEDEPQSTGRPDFDPLPSSSR